MGLGITALVVSAVAVPLYLSAEKMGCYLHGEAKKNAQRMKVAQRRQSAAVQLLIEQRRQDEKRLRLADDLQIILSSGCAEVEVTLDDIMSLEALPAYGSTWRCKLCFLSNFRRPLDRLSHLVLHASGSESLPEKLHPGAVAEAFRAACRNDANAHSQWLCSIYRSRTIANFCSRPCDSKQ